MAISQPLLAEELLSPTGRPVIVDAYGLYHISQGHSPEARRLRDLALNRSLQLVTPAVVLAVSSGMRTCLDDRCQLSHDVNTAGGLRRFYDDGGVQIINSTTESTFSAGQLYMRCGEQRLMGSEVLAACHAVLLARSFRALLVSAYRALYCYQALTDSLLPERIHFLEARSRPQPGDFRV